MQQEAKQATKARSFEEVTRELLADFGRQRPMRTGSLVISVFGDAIAPHGGSVWLGSIINALKPFGVSDRLVRTSVFRLSKEGWLRSERNGRRSYYCLTDRGLRRFQEASRRIYSEPRQHWRGNWTLVLLATVEGERREEIKKELKWLGFAPFSSNVLAHPSSDMAEVEERLADIDGADRAMIMDAHAHASREIYLRELVQQAWQLEELEDRYAAFLDCFRPAYVAARQDSALDPADAFCVRVLLIHEYRRILLRDPSLPQALLPDRWDGIAAYQLCRNLYHELVAPAEEYLTQNIENAYGPLPPAEPGFHQRFGGQGTGGASPKT